MMRPQSPERQKSGRWSGYQSPHPALEVPQPQPRQPYGGDSSTADTHHRKIEYQSKGDRCRSSAARPDIPPSGHRGSPRGSSPPPASNRIAPRSFATASKVVRSSRARGSHRRNNGSKSALHAGNHAAHAPRDTSPRPGREGSKDAPYDRSRSNCKFACKMVYDSILRPCGYQR